MTNFVQHNFLVLKIGLIYSLLILILPNVAEYQNELILLGTFCVFLYLNNLQMQKLYIVNQEKDTFVATMIHDLKNPLFAQRHLFENLIRSAKNKN